MRPPSEPWKEFDFPDEPAGSLVYYLSDDTSRLPVRHVTREHDNKADPNLETGTYGLFTTCYRGSRSGTVENQRKWLFFTTKHEYAEEYVVSGYYDLSHYAKHPGRWKDYALAAEENIHFVADPLSLQHVYHELDINGSPSVRGTKTLPNDASLSLKAELDKQSDATDQYIEEIRRLERFNQFRTGYRHVGLGRTEPFSWEDAERFMQDPHPECVEKTPSSDDQTGSWRCRACGSTVENAACLRVCRECGEVHTLEVKELPTDQENEQVQSENDPSLFSS